MSSSRTNAGFEFRRELPRRDSGKIFERQLRAPYWEHIGRQIYACRPATFTEDRGSPEMDLYHESTAAR